MLWNCLNKRRFEGTQTTGNEGKFFFWLPVTGHLRISSTGAVKSVGAKTVKLSG